MRPQNSPLTHRVTAESGKFQVVNTEFGRTLAEHRDRRKAVALARSFNSNPQRALSALVASTGQPLGHWQGVLAVEAEETGDDRRFDAGAITWEDSPAGIPLRWVEKDTGQHQNAEHVGWIDPASIKRDGNRVLGAGTYFDEEFGEFLKRAGKSGVSVDLDDEEYTVTIPDEALDEAPTPGGTYPALGEKKNFTKGRLRGATAVSIPAFTHAYIEPAEEALPAPRATAAEFNAMVEQVFQLTPGTIAADAGERAEGDSITHAGVLLVAQDTGRWLMLQRDHNPAEPDDNAGLWEFPGGGVDDIDREDESLDQTSDDSVLTAARREFAEEVGVALPEDAVVLGGLDHGIYRLFVVSTAEEKLVDIDGRDFSNPDDPEGDRTEAVAWWAPEHLMAGGDHIRPEVQDTDWNAVQSLIDETPSMTSAAEFDLELDSDEAIFNWVEKVGGLPKYIKRISKHLREKGMDEGHAIAVAVNVVKKMCASGDINYPGAQQVNAKSRAEACAAVAEWEEKKARASADTVTAATDGKRGIGDGPDGQNGRKLPDGRKGPAKENRYTPDGKPKPKDPNRRGPGRPRKIARRSPNLAVWRKRAGDRLRSALRAAEGGERADYLTALEELDANNNDRVHDLAKKHDLDLGPVPPEDSSTASVANEIPASTLASMSGTEEFAVNETFEDTIKADEPADDFIKALDDLDEAITIHQGHLEGGASDAESQQTMLDLMEKARTLLEEYVSYDDDNPDSADEAAPEDEGAPAMATENEEFAAEAAKGENPFPPKAEEAPADEAPTDLTDTDKAFLADMQKGHADVIGSLTAAIEGGTLSPAVEKLAKEFVADIKKAESEVDDLLGAPAAPDAMDSMTASAAPVAPPDEWFDPFDLDGPTPLTITADGRVFGHLTTWDSCHRSAEYQNAGVCVRPPSDPKAPFFQLGQVVTASGALRDVGTLTVGGGHADRRKGLVAAIEHYDDVAAAGAVVQIHEDKFGVGLFGALVADATPEQVAALRRAPLSGDWRKERGQWRLVAAHAVNVPGYPVPRGLVASVGEPDEDNTFITTGRVERCGDCSDEAIVAAVEIEVPPSIRAMFDEVFRAEADALVASAFSEFDGLADELRDEFSSKFNN